MPRVVRSVRRAVLVVLMGMVVPCLLFSGCGTLLSAGMIKLKFGCLPAGTRIDTPDGPVLVEDLEAGDRVVGYDGLPVAILQLHEYREDPVESRHLSVRFADGATVELSPRHRIGGIPAGRLVPGDVVEGQTVTRVDAISGVSRSFDLLTEDRGYRIGGVPINSMIEEMAGAR